MSWEYFSNTLQTLRSDAGHNSARSFYQDSGGRVFFGCTYRQYLNVEKGVSAPGAKLVEKISQALRLPYDASRRKEFVESYLKSLVGTESLFKLIVSAMTSTVRSAEVPVAPLRKAMVRNYEARSIPFTKEQASCVNSSSELYWVFTVLANDIGHWSVAELAKATGFQQPVVKKSLKRLLKVKLVSEDKKGEYYCPNAGKVYLYPRTDYYDPNLDGLRKLWDQMGDRRGGIMMKQHLFTRASELELREYYPHLIQSVQAADVCTTDRKGPDTAFFLIETVVRKVMPF
ncbi:MAG: hypothetical protein ABIJ96_09345 [Elusimicrobiota bacterium]